MFCTHASNITKAHEGFWCSPTQFAAKPFWFRIVEVWPDALQLRQYKTRLHQRIRKPDKSFWLMSPEEFGRYQPTVIIRKNDNLEVLK